MTQEAPNGFKGDFKDGYTVFSGVLEVEGD